MKKVAILQSNYIPWKGYFDMIASVDEFILFDEVQYTKNDWRNRNQIKTKDGLKWLTIPISAKGRVTNAQQIRETYISDMSFAAKHWGQLEQSYSKSPFFEEVSEWLRLLYSENLPDNLSQLNRVFIEAICKYLNISTKITNSWDYTQEEGRTERLASICEQTGATVYVSGPAAKNYLDEAVFNSRNMQVEWFNYDGYPEYPQLHGEFVHAVSVLDLIFNTGKDAPYFVWGWRGR